MNKKQEMKFCLVRNILVCKIKQYLIFHVKLLSIPYLFQLIKKLFKKRKRIKENAGKKWSLTISNLSWQKPGKKFRTAFVFDHTISHRFNYNQVSPNLKFPPFQIEYSQFSNSRRARLRRFNFPRFRFAHNSTDIPLSPALLFHHSFSARSAPRVIQTSDTGSKAVEIRRDIRSFLFHPFPPSSPICF